MKARLVIIVMLLVAVVTDAKGQQQQDFASRFFSLHQDRYSLTCKTVSPAMMERVLQLPACEDNTERRQLLSEIRTLRIVTTPPGDSSGASLFNLAQDLAHRNNKRYTPIVERQDSAIYRRRSGKNTLEIVILSLKPNGTFVLTDFTGRLGDDFLQRLSR